MVFRQLFDAESSTFSYVLGDETSCQAILVDPVREQIERDLNLIRELRLQLVYVLDTHVHADHVTAAGEIAKRTGSQSVAGRNGAACADVHVDGTSRLRFGSYEISVLETPGHTDDSLSYVVDGRVFTGDALLIRGCGRTDFQNGDPARLFDSITRVLFALPDTTLVCPAHDYRGMTASTIAEESLLNPRIAGKSKEEFVELMRHLKLDAPAKMMEAIPANLACGLSEGEVTAALHTERATR